MLTVTQACVTHNPAKIQNVFITPEGFLGLLQNRFTHKGNHCSDLFYCRLALPILKLHKNVIKQHVLFFNWDFSPQHNVFEVYSHIMCIRSLFRFIRWGMKATSLPRSYLCKSCLFRDTFHHCFMLGHRICWLFPIYKAQITEFLVILNYNPQA